MKRIALFLLTNLAVLVALSMVAHLSGLNQFIGAQGLNFGVLLAFAALFGFGGAFQSPAMSNPSAARGPNLRTPSERCPAAGCASAGRLLKLPRCQSMSVLGPVAWPTRSVLPSR